MSIPKFQHANPPITFEEAMNMILTSIAMEELGFSRIINAESEKLQYILGTPHGSHCKDVSIEEILAVNRSVKSLLDSVTHNQILLKSKMESALEALEEKRRCPPRPIGPTGAIGPTGPAGPMGSPGPTGRPGSCRAVSFPGRPEQCWLEGKALQWSNSGCSNFRPLYLSSDCRRIILNGDGCYAVNFSLNLCADKTDRRHVSIGVQTIDFGKKTDKFIYHAPIVYTDAPFTASASGIFVSTQGNYSSSELMLTLLSPDAVKVKQSSISVMEI